jgi:hypothetical protein
VLDGNPEPDTLKLLIIILLRFKIKMNLNVNLALNFKLSNFFCIIGRRVVGSSDDDPQVLKYVATPHINKRTL